MIGVIKVKKHQRPEGIKIDQQKEHMEQKPEVTSTANTENARLSEAQNRALKHWKSYNQYQRKTAVEAGKCGVALEDVYQELPHGGWGDWLTSVGILQSTADRFRQLGIVVKYLAARLKRKKAGKEVEPDVETRGEA